MVLSSLVSKTVNLSCFIFLFFFLFFFLQNKDEGLTSTFGGNNRQVCHRCGHLLSQAYSFAGALINFRLEVHQLEEVIF